MNRTENPLRRIRSWSRLGRTKELMPNTPFPRIFIIASRTDGRNSPWRQEEDFLTREELVRKVAKMMKKRKDGRHGHSQRGYSSVDIVNLMNNYGIECNRASLGSKEFAGYFVDFMVDNGHLKYTEDGERVRYVDKTKRECLETIRRRVKAAGLRPMKSPDEAIIEVIKPMLHLNNKKDGVYPLMVDAPEMRGYRDASPHERAKIALSLLREMVSEEKTNKKRKDMTMSDKENEKVIEEMIHAMRGRLQARDECLSRVRSLIEQLMKEQALLKKEQNGVDKLRTALDEMAPSCRTWEMDGESFVGDNPEWWGEGFGYGDEGSELLYLKSDDLGDLFTHKLVDKKGRSIL